MPLSHELFHDLLARDVQRGSQRLANRRRFAESRAWSTYATAAGTSLVVAAGGEAAVQHITPPSPLRIQLSDQSNGEEMFLLDLDADSQDDFQFGLSAQVTSAGTTLFPTMTIRRQADVEAIVDGNMLIGSLFFASKLLSGATISANETMTDFGIIRSESNTSMGFATFSGGEWDGNDTGFLGVQFKAGSENDHFGWVRVATESNENGLLALSVSDWAYEDVPGRQILAGDTVGGQQMPGDYDGNETVNGLDFTLWKQTFGDMVATPGSGADGDGNSLVDVGDYNVWRDNLSAEAGSGSAAAHNVPEPATFGLGALALGAAGVAALRRRRDGTP